MSHYVKGDIQCENNSHSVIYMFILSTLNTYHVDKLCSDVVCDTEGPASMGRTDNVQRVTLFLNTGQT